MVHEKIKFLFKESLYEFFLKISFNYLDPDYLGNIDSDDKYFFECKALNLLHLDLQPKLSQSHMLIMEYYTEINQDLQKKFDKTTPSMTRLMTYFIKNFLKYSNLSFEEKEKKKDNLFGFVNSFQNLKKLYRTYKIFKESIKEQENEVKIIDSVYNVMFFNKEKGWFKKYKYEKKHLNKNVITNIKKFLQLIFCQNYLEMIHELKEMIENENEKLKKKQVCILFMSKHTQLIFRIRKLINTIFSLINYLRFFQKKLFQKNHLILNNTLSGEWQPKFDSVERPFSKKEKKVLKNNKRQKSLSTEKVDDKKKPKKTKKKLTNLKTVSKFKDLFMFLLLGNLQYSKTVVKAEILQEWNERKSCFANSSLFNDQQVLNSDILEKPEIFSSKDIQFKGMPLSSEDYFVENSFFDSEDEVFEIFRKKSDPVNSNQKIFYSAAFYDLSFFFEYVFRLMTLFLENEFQLKPKLKTTFVLYNYLLIFVEILEKEKSLLLTKCQLFHEIENILENCTKKKIYTELQDYLQKIYFQIPIFEIKISDFKGTFPLSQIFQFKKLKNISFLDKENNSNTFIFLKDFYKSINKKLKINKKKEELKKLLSDCFLSSSNNDFDLEEMDTISSDQSQITSEFFKNPLFKEKEESPDSFSAKPHKFKIYLKSMFDEYFQEELFLQNLHNLVQKICQKEQKINNKIGSLLKEKILVNSNISGKLLLEVSKKIFEFEKINDQLMEWVLEMDNFEHQFKSTILNFYRGHLGSEFTFKQGDNQIESFHNQTILNSELSGNHYQSFNIYKKKSIYDSDSFDSDENSQESNLILEQKITSSIPLKDLKIVHFPKTKEVNQHFKEIKDTKKKSEQKINSIRNSRSVKPSKSISRKPATLQKQRGKRISISVNKKEIFNKMIQPHFSILRPAFRITNSWKEHKSPSFENIQTKNQEFIKNRRKALIRSVFPDTSSNLIKSLSKNIQNKCSGSNSMKKDIEDDFRLSFESEENFSKKEYEFSSNQHSEIFKNSELSLSSFNIFSSKDSTKDNQLREEKIAEIEKNKIPNIIKEFDFLSIIVETSYASFLNFIKALQRVLLLQTIYEILDSKVCFSRFENDYSYLMKNLIWLDNLSSFQQNEFIFLDNFETFEEKEMIKKTKIEDKWTTEKIFKLKNTSTSKPVLYQKSSLANSSKKSKFLMNPSLRKLTKKASQIINIHSSEELSMTNQHLYSQSSTDSNNKIPVMDSSFGPEKFMCLEHFNNFYLFYLKLRHSFELQRCFQRLILFLEVILFKTERLSYFGNLFSEYSDESIPKNKNLNNFFEFEHDFENQCKNKFSKKIERIVKAIFNCCDALPRVWNF